MNDVRVAREFCFQFFFHFQLPIFQDLREELKTGSLELLRDKISELKETTGILLSDQSNQFVEKQILSALTNYSEIEEHIEKNLKKWKLNRLSKVDHTILLLAVNELVFTKTAPPKVSINEAIELAKKFGTAESYSFINGVLDSVSKTL